MPQVLIRYAEKSSGSSNDANYYIDWNRILKPNTSYKVSFVYNSEGYNISNVTTNQRSSPALLFMNLNQPTYDIKASGNASSVSLVGNLEWQTIQNGSPYTGFLKASQSSNNSFIINSIPNPNLNIKIYDYSLALWTDDAVTPAKPCDYAIILNFEEC